MAPARPAHVHRVRVRPADCDHRGVVHSSRFPVFFEAAMVETLRSLLGSYKELERSGIEFVVEEASLRFTGSARFDDLLKIGVRVRTMGTTSVTLGFDVDVDGVPVATGWHRYVAVGTLELRNTVIPEGVRKVFQVREPARREPARRGT
ncbi:acyl-CoA thioesterase [Umezawaea sp. NPDC059074]|uniref:acyl-CoA thioesterase n=1 Tax=Umezawaea sp. NPDC059074 TaxID=3346716 RepID=UPI0036CE324D